MRTGTIITQTSLCIAACAHQKSEDLIILTQVSATLAKHTDQTIIGFYLFIFQQILWKKH